MTDLPLRDLRILVAEDEYLLAHELSAELDDAGATVVGPVASVQGVLDLLARERALDGAVLDVNMRGEWIFPAADLLAERGVPFVFTTGYDASVIPERFRHVPRCEKPVRMSVIVDAVAQLNAS